MNKKVIIASRNPVKINAVKIGFSEMFKSEKFDFEGVSVPSGVQDQPMDNSTTLIGALNRANNAMSAVDNADFWVGIEGGIEKTSEREMQAFAWIVVRSKQNIGKGKTGTFFLPDKIMNLVNEGKELGAADDMIFNQSNSKQKTGAVGILTGNSVTRTSLYSQGVMLALIPFKQTQLYSQKSPRAQDELN